MIQNNGCCYKCSMTIESKTVIRPAKLYGAETWVSTKRQEKRIEDATVDVRSDAQSKDQE